MNSVASELLEEIFCKLEDVHDVVKCAQVSVLWAKVVGKYSVWESLWRVYLGNASAVKGDVGIKQQFTKRFLQLCECKKTKKCNCIDPQIESFDDLKIRPELLRGIYAYGFERPSKVQKQVIAPLVGGHDVLGQAQAGTGKTASYLIGALHYVSKRGTIRAAQGEGKIGERGEGERKEGEGERKEREGEVERARLPQALVLVPTRELAQGVSKVAESLGEYLELKSFALIGGPRIREDMTLLETKGSDIIVGTPGRTYDMIQRKILNLKFIRVLILDEVDELESRGFSDQVKDIWKKLQENNAKIQVALLSSTAPVGVLALADLLMVDPIIIKPQYDELTLCGVRQFYVNVEKEEWKFEVLLDLYDTVNITQSVIYCNTRRKCEFLSERLVDKGFSVTCLTHEMSHEERTTSMRDFTTGATRICVMTDLIGRDNHPATQLSSIVFINYDIPRNLENYIHRVGRSGAFGRKGLSVTFVTTDEVATLRELESYYQTNIDELPQNFADFI